MKKFEMIPVPEGSGSSVKDFNIKDDMFYVTRGTYGGVKCTLVKFNNCDLTFCFKGIVNFENEMDVIREILAHDINNFYKILSFSKAVSYEAGYEEGKTDLKKSLQDLILG